jgi:hypothetical protein
MGAHLMFANAIHFVVWSSNCSTTAESKLADSNYYSLKLAGDGRIFCSEPKGQNRLYEEVWNLNSSTLEKNFSILLPRSVTCHVWYILVYICN